MYKKNTSGWGVDGPVFKVTGSRKGSLEKYEDVNEGREGQDQDQDQDQDQGKDVHKNIDQNIENDEL